MALRVVALLGLLVALIAQSAHAGTGRIDSNIFDTPIYTAEGNAFVRHSGDRFNNRPLYDNQITGFVIAGDRPLVRFGEKNVLHATFIAALLRGGTAKWLHDFSDVTSSYRADRMEWKLQDTAFGPTVLTLDAVPPANGCGMELHLQIDNEQPGDKLIWACGGNSKIPGGMETAFDMTTGYWNLTSPAAKQKLLWKFLPDQCAGNVVMTTPDGFTTQVSSKDTNDSVIAQCSAPSTMTVADANSWMDPLKLASSAGTDRPVACAVTRLDGLKDVYWSMSAQGAAAAAPISPVDAFNEGMQRAVNIENQVVVDTPDPRLNAEVAVSNAVIDGVFRNGFYTHSGMRWGVPLLGWRTTEGGTVYGWHDRVMLEAQIGIAHQIKQSNKTVAIADPKYRMASQSPDSRLFGVGRVDYDQPPHYDMQTQFFDQLIYAWRYTGDPNLEKLLRPALDLHSDYIRDCFDPNDTGLYESYANTWPTDDQWYDGGGTAEETAYAYNVEKTLVEMDRRAGDQAGVAKHQARVERIYKAFTSKLWIPSNDYVGGWVEQGGHQRLHDDCWLYAIFCPIDAGMLDREHAAESLYYTEWGLEREHMPYGGERCWTSNWVPSIWSLREMWPGDCYGLSLAYFQNGEAQEGWDLLRGTFPAMAFYGPTPGDLGYPSGGADFNDCAGPFCRTVVEGLFGYSPNYPDGVVTIAPQFPPNWDHASIKTPDFSLSFKPGRYEITLAKAAALDLCLPVRAKNLNAVIVNGRPVKWELLPGFGCSIAKIETRSTISADVHLITSEPLPQFPAVAIETMVGRPVGLSVKGATVVRPETIPQIEGYHLVDELIKIGNAPQIRIFKVKVDDPAADAAENSKYFTRVPAHARWFNVDLRQSFNGDIRTIFQQDYLSPRPQTCSLRLATDGFSTWQEMLGGTPTDPTPNPSKAPPVDLTNVSSLLDKASGDIMTPEGVPFTAPSGIRNIAFTSMWDNWPKHVTVPVNQKGDGVSLLLCGFTNPMQGRISNAEVRLNYADGSVEKVELIPPFNFWSMCPFGGSDYNYSRDSFALPKIPPPTVQLGKNCRAILLNLNLKPKTTLQSITLETLSQEVIIGLMGAGILDPTK